MTIDYFCNTPSDQWDLIHTIVSYDSQATYGSVRSLCQAIERDLVQFKETTEDQEKKALADKLLLDNIKILLNLNCMNHEEKAAATPQEPTATGSGAADDNSSNVATQPPQQDA
ncbi:hypothetical protein K492DRAFT_234001 [Lichtheimia hyalospora FSU 10163]|nr:hypothetical protein K492DRAFT_234001 [Lichtheimia hyalospora FSU 10163]